MVRLEGAPLILGFMPLLWRVFLINAFVLSLGVAALALTPATISNPVLPSQAAILAMGLVVMLALNFFLLRTYIRPLHELVEVMDQVDLLAPGGRIAWERDIPELRHVGEAFNLMLERLEDERRRSAHRVLTAQEQERLRVARDLHDGIGQRLTGILLQLQRLAHDADGDLRERVDVVRDDVRTSLEEVRDTARRLRPEALEDLGLASALVALAHDVARATGLVVERRLDPQVAGLDTDVEVAVYRVAQEALTNVARHAAARRATIDLRRVDDALVLEICDDGGGFDPAEAPQGAGLSGMRERALAIAGQLHVDSGDGGTIVRLRAPWRGRAWACP